MVLANHLTDTKTKRYYFDRAFLSVQPGTSGYKLTWSGGGSPHAKVSKRTATYTLLELDLGARLYSGKSATYRLAFDIVDAGGAATRDVRIGVVARLVPGLGVRHGLDAGQHRPGRLPGRLRGPGRVGLDPGPDQGRVGQGHLPDRKARRARCRSSPISWPIGRPPTPTRS